MRMSHGPWPDQATLGFPQPNSQNRNSPDHRNVSPANLITSSGVVLRPHLLGYRAAKAAE
ncbi:hypothetical protein GCM10022409_28590 [Hymenobacter glaciei]|uniref:Uncharacterized protein n=1 Tax=Hymenobacter glaciei TaxID=877209 RepID=A0ABP7UDD3_9BACT